MIHSIEYHALCKRISALRKRLLPIQFDLTGSYTPQIFDQARGFIALAHAEIEAFIEDRCLFVAKECVKKWHVSKTPSAVVFTLYAMCYSDWVALDAPPSFRKGTTEVRIEARIDDALEQYKRIVGENHGIKEANLRKLLVPLSVRLKTDVDSAWLGSMSSFGGKRGLVVHTSWKTNSPPDPKDTIDAVSAALLPGLNKLDLLLTSLLGRAISDPPLPARKLIDRMRSAWKSFWA